MSIVHQGFAAVTTPQTMRVLLVEDQEVLRLGLKLSFQGMSEIEIIAEAADGPSAVEKALALKPSLILMDIALPGFDGIVATRRIKAAMNDMRVLILSSHGEDEYVFPALEAGADGYCLKDVSKETLLTAMRTVSQGHTWLDDNVAERLLKSLRRVDPEVTSQHYQLSDTEMNVLYSILEGAPIEKISEQLGIPMNKVHSYTRRVLHKIANTSSASESLPNAKERPRKITLEHQLARICSKCRAKLPSDSDVCPFDGAEAKDDKMVGTTFADRYEILSVLGSGSGGTVYKARHRFMNRLAAIKVMHPELMTDLDLVHRFRQEAAAASCLEHPNVIRVIDFGVANDGTAFMIQEYVEGHTLRELIDSEGAIPAPIAHIGRHLPAILNGIVMKALRKEPSARYRSMEELMVYLDGAVV